MTEAIVRTVSDVWNEADFERTGDVFAADVVVHDIPLREVYEGIDAFNGWVTGTRATFSGLTVEVHDVLVTDGKTVSQWTARGTNEGPIFGSEPTNRTAEWEGVTIYRVEGETVTEAWWYYDLFTIYEQLGLVPEQLPA
jgi:steroid delta-isomerase-like uncharacterized protein